MPDMDALLDTWGRRDQPILRSALRRMDSGDEYISLSDIQVEVGLNTNQMRAGITALESAFPPYMTTQLLFAEDTVQGHVMGVSERARRELRTWPTSDDVLDRLVAADEALADKEPDAEKQSMLRIAARVFAGMARDVVTAVLSQKLGTL
jgi:hypothetical protein